MIIVSNIAINKPCTQQLKYNDFIEKATSDEGLDIDSGLSINVNDMDEGVFDQLNIETTIFFTLNGTCPEFVKGKVQVEDYSSFIIEENTLEFNENNIIQSNNDNAASEEIKESISHLLDGVETDSYESNKSSELDNKDARIYVFGSSKGGTGKTFTSIISTYRYAKTHPNERIALVDFDIIDGQVGISIHAVKPTMARYYTEYQKGFDDFKTMKNFAVKGNNVFPQNVDFYLAPSTGGIIENDNFWFNVIQNCMKNYDVVVFDTGIDYLNITPISYAYKIADKINLVTTTSIKSVNSVTKQIGRLKGEIRSPGKDGNMNVENVFSQENGLAPILNVIITQMVETNPMNRTIFESLSSKCNVIATFGVITDSVSQAEFFGAWDVFDKNPAINQSLDRIMA